MDGLFPTEPTTEAAAPKPGAYRVLARKYRPTSFTDLIGQDVNLAVTRSVWEQTYHDPRYAPTVFQTRLVDAGRSVVVIEHHQAVLAHADWIIDLGPGAGHDGGRVVFEGTPADLVAARSTLTGEHLAAYVGG